MTTDRTPRLIITLGFLAALASCATSPAHADEPGTPRYGEDGKPCPTVTAPPPQGLYPLTMCSPALPPSTYLHPAYPEVRPYAAPSATTRTTGTVSTPHGVLRFDSTSKN